MQKFTTSKIASALRRLMGAPEPAQQAAALVWRPARNGMEVLLITSRGTGRWVLPKGWPEKGEHYCDAALREAREEAGVEGKVSPDAIGSFVFDKDLGEGIARNCEVFVFPVKLVKERSKWPEHKQRKRVWVSAERAATMVREPELAEIIAIAGGKLQKQAA